MHNFLRYPLCSIPSSGAIDPSSVHCAPVPLPSSQTTNAQFATHKAEVVQGVQSKVKLPAAEITDHAGTAIESKAVTDRNIQQATGQSLPSIKGDQLDKPDQKELKETQDQLLKQADELLKKSNENKAVTASLGGLKQTVAELKKTQNDSPIEVLKALKNMDFPPALKVKITLKNGEKLSLIPPGDELENQLNLGQLMEKAVAVLEKHHDENFASFDQATTDREITNLKQQVSDIDQQIGEEAAGINDFARLENRQCLLSINIRARVQDGSVNARHIDGGPIPQQQTMGTPLAGPGHTATTDLPSQTNPEPDNDRPVMPEPTAQELTDSSPADPDISINPPDTGGDTAPPDDLDVEVTFDNPVVGGSGQDASLIPGIVQSPSENFTPGTSSQPDVTQQTGDTGEDYSELDGVTELFAESDSGEDYSELDGVTELFAESDSGESTALDGQKTDVSKSASSGGEVPIDSSTVTDGADQSDVDTGSIQTEAESTEVTSAGDDDSKLEGVAESIVDTESVQTEVESTEKSLVEEDYSELDGVTESFAESENSGDSAALDGQEKEVDIRARSGDEVTIDNSTPTDEADQSEADPEPIETEADTQSIQTEAKSTEKTSVEEDYTELDGVTELFAESEDVGDSTALDDNQETDVSVSERSGDKAPIDSVTTTGGDDQSDVGTESIQTEAESTEETSVEEDFSELDGVAAGIDDSEQSETALQRSDDSGSSQASISEETVFTAESPDPLDPVSSDSDYFSDDESDQGTTQTLSPEPDLSTDVAKESASMERADVVRQSTANIREIAKRRKESLRAASASTTPSPAPSSPAPRPASGVINKPVDLSGVKSVVSAQTKAPRKTKSTDTIPKEERAIDKRKLGVSSTYNEASVIQNAFVKLQKNASNLKDSRDIAKTARKYISSEAQDSGPLLSHPNPQQKKALSFLGLNSNASERQIRLALLDKAEQSAGSNGREKHENTMKALSIYCDALFNKR